jgi:hypothetical protein
MVGDVEVEDAPAIMRKYDKYKQNLEPMVCTVKKSIEAS